MVRRNIPSVSYKNVKKPVLFDINVGHCYNEDCEMQRASRRKCGCGKRWLPSNAPAVMELTTGRNDWGEKWEIQLFCEEGSNIPQIRLKYGSAYLYYKKADNSPEEFVSAENPELMMLEKKCSEFKTLNDFFSREMADRRRPNILPNGTGKTDMSADINGYCPLISGADGRVMIYENLDDATRFWVKEREFSLGTFLGTESTECTAERCYKGCVYPRACKVICTSKWKIVGQCFKNNGLWETLKLAGRNLVNLTSTHLCGSGENACPTCNGTGAVTNPEAIKYTNELLYREPQIQEGKKNPSLVIFRLAPQDYHRFHYAVSGTVIDHYAIKGVLFSVNPGAVNNEAFKVFQENQRYVTVIETKSGQKVFAVSVGAAMVGSIVFEENNGKSCVEKGTEITAGQLHGKMRYGGSTVVYVFEDGMVDYDQDLLNRCKGTWKKGDEEWPMMETYYQVSEKLGNSKYRAARGHAMES